MGLAIAKQFTGVSYDNLAIAYRVWLTVGNSPFTAKLAATIIGNGVTARNFTGRLRQMRFGGVIEDSAGNRRSHYSTTNGGESTRWVFTNRFKEWAKQQDDPE